jgi:ABC-2 type transport system ATP-binding protein
MLGIPDEILSFPPPENAPEDVAVPASGAHHGRAAFSEADNSNGAPRAAAPRPILEVRDLSRKFGAVAAVDGVSLSAYEGEIYGFLGINGAGKTTTIRLIMGIIAAQAGAITVLHETTRRTSVAQKQQIGYVSQEQNFYPWMTCKALGRFVGSFYPTWDSAEYSRLLAMFELPPNRRSSELSGGMRAKLALALALASRPALLILDEPTAGLDPVARREFMEIIVAQARQHRRTTFFSSHLIDEVERCADRVGIIHQGRMRFEGALTELRRRVRRLQTTSSAPFAVPEGFEIWRDEEVAGARTLTLSADPADWNQWLAPGSPELGSLTLEEIFIACVGSRRIRT